MTRERRIRAIELGTYDEQLRRRKEHNRTYYLKHRAKSEYRDIVKKSITLKRNEIGQPIYD